MAGGAPTRGGGEGAEEGGEGKETRLRLFRPREDLEAVESEKSVRDSTPENAATQADAPSVVEEVTEAFGSSPRQSWQAGKLLGSSLGTPANRRQA